MDYNFAPVSQLADKFGNQFSTHAQADAFLQELIYKSSRLKLSVQKYNHEEQKDQIAAEEKQKELAEVTDRIPLLQYSADSATVPSVKQEYVKALNDENERKKKLQEWLQQHHPIKENLAFVKNQVETADLQYTHEVAIALCEWFATGAAGPGVLTYEGKTYTAS